MRAFYLKGSFIMDSFDFGVVAMYGVANFHDPSFLPSFLPSSFLPSFLPSFRQDGFPVVLALDSLRVESILSIR